MLALSVLILASSCAATYLPPRDRAFADIPVHDDDLVRRTVTYDPSAAPLPANVGMSAPKVGQISCNPPAVQSCSTNSSVKASATYGTGGDVRLRIANGGAGLSGLVGALAEAFEQWASYVKIVDAPFKVDWITSDTTYTIKALANGDADIGITYTPAAENRSQQLCTSQQRVYGFRDHFLLVGPTSNPANLSKSDDVSAMLNKIVTAGAANTPTTTNPTRFLSRYDASATNIRESLLFASIGQAPWADPPANWYHRFPVYPGEALAAASLLQQYTLTDRGTLLTLKAKHPSLADPSVLTTYKAGGNTDANDPLLLPASVLLGSKVCSKNLELARWFMWWMVQRGGGQAVVGSYAQAGSTDVLYSMAPDCAKTPALCKGW